MEPDRTVISLESMLVPSPVDTRAGDGVVTSGPWRSRVRRMARLGVWREAPRLVVVVGGVIFLTFSVLRSSVSLYLPPDGAHYIADADALIGNGVRRLLHPPAFPTLVAGARTVVGDVAAFQVAMGVSLGLLIVALYVLLRRWASPGPSLIGAACGVLMPVTAELLGWGGGATLLGIAFLLFSLDAMEAWIAGRRLSGIAVGLTLGLSALSHPFVFMAASFFLGTRWVLLLARRRRLGWGWDPLGLRGMASAVAPLVLAIVVAAPYYLGLQGGGGFGLRTPSPEGLPSLLSWALGDNPLPWLLLCLGFLAPLAFGDRGQVTYVMSIGLMLLVSTTSIRVDDSYVTRVAYLLPIVVAIGVGCATERLLNPFTRLTRTTRKPRALATAIVLTVVGVLAFSSYGPRLQRSSVFYAALDPEDVLALEELRGHGNGVVATSWEANRYGHGVSNSWFLEGISKRRAFGPSQPWLSTVREQREAGLDMQRFFAGTEGIENGALQMTAAPPGVRADPAVQVWSEGFYFPVLYSNSLVNTYPAAFTDHSSREILGDTVTWTFRNGAGEPVLRQTGWLDGAQIVIHYELVSDAPPGDWSVWFWPAYGMHWSDVRSGTGMVEARQSLPDEDIGFRLIADGAEVAYDQVESRFGVEAIQIRETDSATLTVRLEFDMGARPGSVQGFTEQEIIERRDISDVVVWKSTGWQDRFDRDDCYALTRESSGLLVYRVLPGICASDGGG